MNCVWLRCVLEKIHIELQRPVADGGNFICVRRVRKQNAFVIPNKFLARQPARALHKAAFDLAAVDAGIYRIAGVMQNVRAQNARHASKRVHFDFRDRRADGEIMKRFAFAFRAVVVNFRRAIKSGG